MLGFGKNKAFTDDQIQTVAAEIQRLPKDDVHWTKDGLPDARVLTERCGFSVSGDLRNAAFNTITVEKLKTKTKTSKVRHRKMTFVSAQPRDKETEA